MASYAGFSRNWTEEDVTLLDRNRVAHIRLRDLLLDAKKACETRRDFPSARWLSDEAKDVMKRVRGATWALEYLRGDRGGDPPAELEPYVKMDVWRMDEKIEVV